MALLSVYLEIQGTKEGFVDKTQNVTPRKWISISHYRWNIVVKHAEGSGDLQDRRMGRSFVSTSKLPHLLNRGQLATSTCNKVSVSSTEGGVQLFLPGTTAWSSVSLFWYSGLRRCKPLWYSGLKVCNPLWYSVFDSCKLLGVVQHPFHLRAPNGLHGSCAYVGAVR